MPTKATNPSASCNPEPKPAEGGYTIPAGINALSAAVRAGILPMPVAAAASVGIDAKLLALYRDYQAFRATFTRAGDNLPDDLLATYVATNAAFVAQIRDAHAASAMGLLVKLRVAAAEMHNDPSDVVEQICADVVLRMERQIGRNGSAGPATNDRPIDPAPIATDGHDASADPVAALGRQMVAANRRANETQGALANGEQWRHFHALQAQAAGMQASSLEGVIVQLSILTNDEFNRPLAVQRDLEAATLRHRRLAYSIIRVLENLAGASCQDLAGLEFFPSGLDPFAKEEAGAQPARVEPNLAEPPDPVAAWGEALGKLQRQNELARVKIAQGHMASLETAASEENAKGMHDRIFALEAIISGRKASSIDGALAQVMLACEEVGELACCKMGSDQADHHLDRAERLLFSVKTVLETITGTSRFALLARRYLPNDYDPFVIKERGEVDNSDQALNRLRASLERLTATNCEELSDTVADAIANEEKRIAQEAAATPATSLEGIATKLRIAFLSSDINDMRNETALPESMLPSVFADLDRLAPDPVATKQEGG